MVNIKHQLYNDLNKLKMENKDIRTHEDRVKVLKQNPNLLKEIYYWSKKIDRKRISLSKYEERNDYNNMLHELAKWITKPKEDGYKKKFKDRFREDTDRPSEIKDNMKTNNRIYKYNGNYAAGGGDLKPTKEELKINHIKTLTEALKYRQKQLKRNEGNRKILSHAIREAHDDLNEAILNHRCQNHTGRTDNTVSPKTTLNTPDHYTPEYIQRLLSYRIEELNDREVRLDKMDVDNVAKSLGYDDDPILIDIEQGFSQGETAKRHDRNQSSVSRHFNTIIKHVYQKMK